MKKSLSTRLLSIILAAGIVAGGFQSTPLIAYASEEPKVVAGDIVMPEDPDNTDDPDDTDKSGNPDNPKDSSGSEGSGGSGDKPDGSSTGDTTDPKDGEPAGNPDGNPDGEPSDGDNPEDPPEEDPEDESEEETGEEADETSEDKSKAAEEEKELPEDFYTEFPTGLVDSGNDIVIESVSDKAATFKRFFRAASLPASYITPNLPPLRNQSPYNSCWAFATVSLAEINLMKTGTMSSPDLSELHTAYFTYNPVVDPLGGTEGDVSTVGKGALDYGGRTEWGLNSFAKWQGVADESVADYASQAAASTTKGLSEDIAYDDVAHLKNYYLEPVSKDTDTITATKHENVKKLIYTYGAAAINFKAYNSASASTTAEVYNVATNAYYSSTAATPNHAVVVVGWDDNFSASNFAQTPPGDGAFLVRNSWKNGKGSAVEDNYGYSGYFWMSYYEATLDNEAIAAEFDLASDYDNNYEYDGGADNADVDVTKAANVFTAHAEGGQYGEKIRAASFFTPSSNVSYTIEVYTDLEDSNNPESGTLHEEATVSGTTGYAGYYTVDLGEAVYMRSGTEFSVVLTLSKAGSSPKIAVEFTHSSIGSAACLPGQSFVSGGSRWTDMKQFGLNVKLKAFTDNATEEEYVPPTHTISYVLGNGTQNEGNPDIYAEGDEFALLDPTPVSEDYHFEGWYLDASFSEDSKRAGVLATDTEDLTFYAKWVRHYVSGISITDSNGSDPGSAIDAGKSITLYGKVQTVPEDNTLTGYSWYNYGTDEEPVYANISPEGAATVTLSGEEGHKTLLITVVKTGTVTVKAVSDKDSRFEAVKTFEIKEKLPKSIILQKTADTNAEETAEYGFRVRKERESGSGEGSQYYEENLKSSLTLSSNLYTVTNPGSKLDEVPTDFLSADQGVVFSVSDADLITITEQGTRTLIDDRGNEYLQHYVTVAPAAGLEVPEGVEGAYTLTAKVIATSVVNTAIRAEYQVIIDFGEQEEIEVEVIEPSELQIISTDREPKIYASSRASRVVDEDGVVLRTGASVTLKTRIVPDEKDKTVIWASANPAVANVTAAGKVTARAAGDVVLTATSQSGSMVAPLRVSVYDPVTSLVLDKKSIKLGVGQTANIGVASILPTTASDEVSYESNKPAVVSVDDNGNIIAHSAGSAAITVKSAHGEKSAKCTVTVGNSVQDIALKTKGDVSVLAAGKTVQLLTVFNHGDKKNQPVNKEVVWNIVDESSNGVATVNAKGVITAKKEGWVIVRARSTTDTYDGEFVESNTVRIDVFSPMKKAALNKTAVSIFGNGEKSFTLVPMVTPTVATANDEGTVTGSSLYAENCEYCDVREEIVWRCKNTADRQYICFPEGSFEEDGVMQFVGSEFTFATSAEGLTKQKVVPVQAIITPYGATRPTVLTCNVTVLPESAAAVSKITLSKSRIAINRGADAVISANLTPMVPAEAGVIWEIESGSEFVNIENADGNSVRVKALSPDENVTDKTKAVIKATTVGTNSKGVQLVARATIDIGNEANEVLISSGKTDVTWTNDTSTNPDANNGKLIQLATGKKTTLKAVVYNSYDAAAPKSAVKAANQKVVWSSSDTSVATVNASGVVSAVGNGYAYIYAESADSVNGSAKVTSRALVYVYNAASKISLDKTKATLGTAVSDTTVASSFRQYDVVTPVMLPDLVFDNCDITEDGVSASDKTLAAEKHKITWKFSAGKAGEELIAVAPIDTDEIRAARDGYGKQNMIAVHDSEFKAVAGSVYTATGTAVTTGEGESLAIKALRPGTIKITAVAPGGRTATCTVTVYSHVSEVKLKLAWDSEDGDMGAYTASVIKTYSVNKVKEEISTLSKASGESYDYRSELDLKYAKSVTLTPILDLYGGEGEVIPYSDKRSTPAQKAATARYNNTRKYMTNTTVNYLSSNPAVASVNARGVITAKSPGTAYITVSTQDGSIKKTILVQVK